MKIDQQLKFIVIHKQADSLYSLIADGQYRNTSLGRDKWKELNGSQGSLQYDCNKEGFNFVCSHIQTSKARIGIVSNNENKCDSCDSRIGFGTGGYPNNSTRVVTRPVTSMPSRQSHQSHGIHLGTIKMTYVLQKI